VRDVLKGKLITSSVIPRSPQDLRANAVCGLISSEARQANPEDEDLTRNYPLQTGRYRRCRLGYLLIRLAQDCLSFF